MTCWWCRPGPIPAGRTHLRKRAAVLSRHVVAWCSPSLAIGALSAAGITAMARVSAPSVAASARCGRVNCTSHSRVVSRSLLGAGVPRRVLRPGYLGRRPEQTSIASTLPG